VFYVMTPEQISDATTAIDELKSYVDDLTKRRGDDAGPDLITALLASEDDGQRLTHAETVTMIANLLVAGHDTTGSQIPCSILVALQHLDELVGVDKNAGRLASAVTETMRLEPSIPIIPRTAIAPIELHGTTIPAGGMVFLCIAAACRDESAWSDPDDFDPDRFTRPDTPTLLNFGAGAHYCLGTALAKVAVNESVRAVVATDPPLRLTEDPLDIPWSPGARSQPDAIGSQFRRCGLSSAMADVDGAPILYFHGIPGTASRCRTATSRSRWREFLAATLDHAR
jgi:hypothetical protein